MELAVLKVMTALRRLDWVFNPSPVYFVTACTFQRRHILARPDVHEAFISFTLRGPERGVWVGRYVLMPDHLHLFARFGPDAVNLSTWQKSFKNAMSRVLRYADIPPPHWERGFFDHVIRSDESYRQKCEYVRHNPVRAGLVKTADGTFLLFWRPSRSVGYRVFFCRALARHRTGRT